jgi:2-methylcitrate dehydratase PrpD
MEGPFGYLSLFEDQVDLTPVLDDLDRVRRIEELSWKPFPTGRAAHGAIIALRQLIAQHGLTPGNLARFVYRAPPLIHRLVGRRPHAGMSVAYARLCFAWLAALVLTRGTVDLADFTPERLGDPELLALAQRIVVEVDGNPDPAAFVPAVGTATLADGTAFTVEVARQFGSPEWPLSREEHLEKARRCLEFGGQAAIHEPLAGLIDRLETAQDVAAALLGVVEDDAKA